MQEGLQIGAGEDKNVEKLNYRAGQEHHQFEDQHDTEI